MPSTLIFPDGVRLAAREEIPGNAARRAEERARIQSADIAPGFVLKPSGDTRFDCYVEINVDAPQIFCAVRRSLSRPARTGRDAVVRRDRRRARSDRGRLPRSCARSSRTGTS